MTNRFFPFFAASFCLASVPSCALEACPALAVPAVVVTVTDQSDQPVDYADVVARFDGAAGSDCTYQGDARYACYGPGGGTYAVTVDAGAFHFESTVPVFDSKCGPNTEYIDLVAAP